VEAHARTVIFTDLGDDGGGLYTIKTDGSDRKKLNDDEAGGIWVAGNRIYYSNDDGGLYTIKTDGSDRRKLNDEVAEIIGMVFFINCSLLL